MKKLLLTFILAASLSFSSVAHDHGADPYRKTFISNTRWQADPVLQQELKNTAVWQHFIQKHGDWKVIFNEHNGLPRIAAGKPVQGILSSSPEAIASAFLTTELAGFRIPRNELVLRSIVPNKKMYYVHYRQVHKGLEVLWSKARISMSKDGKINSFSLDLRNNINVNITPSLSRMQAAQAAVTGMRYVIQQTTVEQELKILPVPAGRSYRYHLVYQVYADALNEEGFPARYFTLVDAHSGEVLYRQNKIHNACCSSQPSANIDLNLEGSAYPNNPYNPMATVPIQHAKVVVGGIIYFTDNTGYLGLSNTSPVTATIYLEGRWARVQTGNTVPSFTVTLNPGQNTITFNNNSNIKERTAYWSVQQIHDYYKSFAIGSPAENTMDFVMETNVDVAGSCNAFYNGSINFFAQGNGCNATSLCPDVVYHEYGHGINYDVYNAYGGSWDNGAMGEGYSDLWANAITEDPVLGIGFFMNNPAGYIRRYDINPKVYPQDLVGQVHADGEIIAGAWWDTGINFGSQQDRMALLWETYAALCTAPDGDEGFLYTDILYNALLADDNDFDLTNGTPRFCEITTAFARHGLFESGSTAEVNHTEALAAAAQSSITINASLSALIPNSSISGYYKSNGQGAWVPFTMNNTGGLNYSGVIPPQPAGSILHYYLDYVYGCGAFSTPVATLPVKANNSVNPNIPFYVLINYNLLNSNYVENATGWTLGVAGDSATTGVWIIDVPVATYLSGNSGMVQPGFDHTPPPGTKCAVTGNDSPGSGVGSNDVDGGKTTLISPAYDLSSYTNPAFTYWRWYTNDQGNTPGTDFWQVAVSNDGGNSWVDIENTNVSDHSWRRFAFRVADYVSPTANVKLRFIAEDGGTPSLVEALVDDLELWDVVPTSVAEIQNIILFSAFPVPAKNELNIRFSLSQSDDVSIRISDMTGRLINEIFMNAGAGFNSLVLPLNKLAAGSYMLSMRGNKTNHTHRFVVE